MFIKKFLEKAASVAPLGPFDFLAASIAELEIFLDMKLDHHRYYELSSCVFLVSFTSEFSSKLDCVVLPGSVDDAALPVLTKKNRDRINNFKNLQKVLLMSVILVVITSKYIYKKQLLQGIYEKSKRVV